MLKDDEEKFLLYWEKNRLKEKKLSRQLLSGLPIGSLIATAILVSFLSGWYQRADMVAGGYNDYSVLIVALLIIVIFIAVLYKRHRWDLNEEEYWRLKKKKEKEANSLTK